MPIQSEELRRGRPAIEDGGVEEEEDGSPNKRRRSDELVDIIRCIYSRHVYRQTKL